MFSLTKKWAKQVLTLEQNLTRKERLKQQKKYATVRKDGQKVFLVKWKQTVELFMLIFHVLIA